MNIKQVRASSTHLSADILSQMKQIEINTRRLLRGIVSGNNRSAQKGMGFDFDQIREYQRGDDVRLIDWSGSARTGQLLVRQYIQERSRTLLLVVDVSCSTFFTSGSQLKHDNMVQMASVLALIAESSNDNVGLLLFSDTVELYMPPRKGMEHVRGLMRTLFLYEPKGTRTCFESMFKKIAELKRRDTIVFLLSDFIGELHSSYCKVVTRECSLVAVRCSDKNEQEFPSVGFVPVLDRETGELITLDTRKNAYNVNAILTAYADQQNRFFRGQGIRVLDLIADKPFIGDVVRFFKRYIR